MIHSAIKVSKKHLLHMIHFDNCGNGTRYAIHAYNSIDRLTDRTQHWKSLQENHRKRPTGLYGHLNIIHRKEGSY